MDKIEAQTSVTHLQRMNLKASSDIVLETGKFTTKQHVCSYVVYPESRGSRRVSTTMPEPPNMALRGSLPQTGSILQLQHPHMKSHESVARNNMQTLERSVADGNVNIVVLTVRGGRTLARPLDVFQRFATSHFPKAIFKYTRTHKH